MHERRRQKRRRVSYYLAVFDASTQQMLGHLVDINQKGFMIDCQKPLLLEKEYNLHLDITDEQFDKSFLNFTARSKWYRPDELTPNLYNVGFEIVDISSHDAEIVKQMAEKYAKKEGYSLPWNR